MVNETYRLIYLLVSHIHTHTPHSHPKNEKGNKQHLVDANVIRYVILCSQSHMLSYVILPFYVTQTTPSVCSVAKMLVDNAC